MTPLGPNHTPDPNGSFVQPGASTIYREQGSRMIAVKFDVRGRDLASAVAEAQEMTASIVKPPYRVDWSGEFEEMQDAEARLMFVIPVALLLIVVLLYINFRSLVDVVIVLSNVLVLCLGGILGAAADEHQFQRFGRGRIHLDFRRGDHGRIDPGLVVPPSAAAWQAAWKNRCWKRPAIGCGRC